MNLLEVLTKEARTLTPEMQQEVVRFIKFLKKERGIDDAAVLAARKANRSKMFGMYKGQGWVSDDFDWL